MPEAQATQARVEVEHCCVCDVIDGGERLTTQEWQGCHNNNGEER
jgi:hypothetical protein